MTTPLLCRIKGHDSAMSFGFQGTTVELGDITITYFCNRKTLLFKRGCSIQMSSFHPEGTYSMEFPDEGGYVFTVTQSINDDDWSPLTGSALKERPL